MQFWIDQSVLDARPRLLFDIHGFFDRHRDRLRPAGVHATIGGEAVKNDWAHTERFLAAINDADLEQAVKWAHAGIMSNQGQICTATSRILVQRDIYPQFIAKYKETVSEVSKIGSQWDENTFQGPQISKAQLDRILSTLNKSKATREIYSNLRLPVG